MDEWSQWMYSLGYKYAEEDIANEGIEYAIRHASNINDSGHYALGYQTAVGVSQERVQGN